MENKPNAITLLLSMNCKMLYNYIDMTAIDYAIHYKYQEAALAMVTQVERGSEIMALRSDKHPCVTLALIASMPKVFEAVQDKCITKANCKKDSKSFYVSRVFFVQEFIGGFRMQKRYNLLHSPAIDISIFIWFFIHNTNSDNLFILLFTMSDNVCSNG